MIERKYNNRDHYIRLSKGMKGAQYHGWIDIIKYLTSRYCKNFKLDILTIPDIKYLHYLEQIELPEKNIYFNNERNHRLIYSILFEFKHPNKNVNKKILYAIMFLWERSNFFESQIEKQILSKIDKLDNDVFAFLINKIRIDFTTLDNNRIKWDNKNLLDKVGLLLKKKCFIIGDVCTIDMNFGPNIRTTIMELHKLSIRMILFIKKYNIKLSQDDINNILNNVFKFNNLADYYGIDKEDHYLSHLNELFNLFYENNIRLSKNYVLDTRIHSIWTKKLIETSI